MSAGTVGTPGLGESVTHTNTTNYVDNSFTVNGGGQGETPDWKPQYNAAQSRYPGLVANLPAAGN